MEQTLNLDDLSNTEQVLERTPSGAEVQRLAVRLGLIDGTATKVARRPFRHNLSQLAPAALSDEQGWWSSEFGRIMELHGLLVGQQKLLSLEAKKARASVRSRLRKRAAEDEARITQGELNDLAEDDPSVREVDERGAMVELLLAATSTSKEVIERYLNTLSREIAFRQAQMDARIY
ncbi:MAG: hypothetical protein GY882_01625 [Actinomycetia bacterium]|nr:hypothetical protein [Actinomycetes bacterium]MCP4844869.1 hypothetical protein [Actinomycetes bacterium]